VTDAFAAWIAEHRASIDANADLSPKERSVLHAFTDFGEQHRAYPTGGTVDLWGFGTVQKMAQPIDGGWWVALNELSAPTGLSYVDLIIAFDEERQSGSGDAAVLYWHDPDSDQMCPLPLVRHDFVMRVFAGRSPWRQEFFNNTVDLMAHAVIQHGVGGPELAEAIAGDDLPSEEEARRRAFAGPSAAIPGDAS
jgi:hypothetical protein